MENTGPIEVMGHTEWKTQRVGLRLVIQLRSGVGWGGVGRGTPSEWKPKG